MTVRLRRQYRRQNSCTQGISEIQEETAFKDRKRSGQSKVSFPAAKVRSPGTWGS